MTDELVERLRELAIWAAAHSSGEPDYRLHPYSEAANVIEAQEARIARLEGLMYRNILPLEVEEDDYAEIDEIITRLHEADAGLQDLTP